MAEKSGSRVAWTRAKFNLTLPLVKKNKGISHSGEDMQAIAKDVYIELSIRA